MGKNNETETKIGVLNQPSLLTNWKEYLKTYEINTEYFNSETFLVVESSPKYFKTVDVLVEKINIIEQSRIRTVIWNRVEKMAHGKVPVEGLGEIGAMLERAAAEAGQELSKNKVLSIEMLAIFIKLEILIIRQKYLMHKENFNELRQEEDEELAILLDFEEKKKNKKRTKRKEKKTRKDNQSTSNRKTKAKTRTRQKPEKKLLDCDVLNQTNEFKSFEIKRRMRDLGQSENFVGPFEGIDLYFVIFRTYDNELLQELTKIGINLTSLIDFGDNSTNFFVQDYCGTPFDCSTAEQIRESNISNFWETLGELPKTVGYLRYCPENLDDERIYHDLIKIAYNITGLKRLHQEYLQHIKVLDLKGPESPIKLRQMKVYNKILDRIPNELITVPLVLHALLEELASRIPIESQGLEIDQDPPPSPGNYHESAKEQVEKLLNRIYVKNHPKHLSKQVTAYKMKLLRYGNILDYQLTHARCSEDLKRINLKAMKNIAPLTIFDHYIPIHEERKLHYKYLFQKWAKDFEFAPINRLKHCLHAYYLVHGKFSKTTTTTIPVNISKLFFSNFKPYNDGSFPQVLFDVFSQQKFLISSITRVPFENHSYCEYFEEYSSDVMIQVVNVAWNDHKEFQHKFIPAHDVVLLRFKTERTGVQEKCQLIKTPVCFRDFCAYVVNSEFDWLLKKEGEYWKDVRKKDEVVGMSIEDAYLFDENDFIQLGSIKDRLLKEKEVNVRKTTKGKKKERKMADGSKRSRKGKNESTSIKSDRSSESRAQKIRSKPSKSEAFGAQIIKPKVFEGYDLGDTQVFLKSTKVESKSCDNITIFIEKYTFSDNETSCSIKIGINDHSIIFNGKIGKDSFLEIQPFLFHIHISNGIIIGFGPRRTSKFTSMDVQGHPSLKKRLGMYKKQRRPPRIVGTRTRTCEELFSEVQNLNNRRTKPEVLRKINEVANRGPIFKICALRTKYVTRIKSCLEIPIGKVVRRLIYKPKFLGRPRRRFLVSKYSQSFQKVNHSLQYDFKSTLPTGLCVHAVQGPKEQSFYIRQGYIIDRNDLDSIDHEDYRCFFKGNVVSFLKTGEVITMSCTRAIEKRKYGSCGTGTVGSVKEQSCGLYHATKNVAEMEKNVKGMNQRQENHKRKESRRECFKEKTCRMYQCIAPVLKLTMITEDGSRVEADKKKIVEEKDKYFTVTYFDYLKRETMKCRQDGTMWFLDSEGRATTQFKDRTRITTWVTLLHEEFLTENLCGDPFVLYEMNYKYEHPNYMTVTELCEEKSTTIEMPDVNVVITEEGSFKVTIREKEVINIDNQMISAYAKACDCGNFFQKMEANIGPFYNHTEIWPTAVFLKILDTKNILTQVDFCGNLTEGDCQDDLLCSVCNCARVVSDRYFVLRRDLSGAEFFIRPPESRYIHTMTNFPKFSPKTDSISRTLNKTYSESLMMLYDFPYLGMGNNFQDSEELFQSFNYDEKSLVLLRTPVFVYERHINHLHLHRVIQNLVEGFFKIENRHTKWKTFKPSNALLSFIQEHIPNDDKPKIEEVQERVVRKLPKRKYKSLKEVIELTKDALNEPIPKYFDTCKGIIVEYVLECVEKAMDLSENNFGEIVVERESSVEVGVVESVVLEESSGSSFDIVDGQESPCVRKTCLCNTNVMKKEETPSKRERVEFKEQFGIMELPETGLSGVCDVSSVCHLSDKGPSFITAINATETLMKTARSIAVKIVKALSNASKQKTLQSLTSDEIKLIVREHIGNLDLTLEESTEILREIETILQETFQDKKSVYKSAMKIIKEIKNEITKIEEDDLNEPDYSQKLLQDVTVKASVSIYNALDAPDETSIVTTETVQTVKNLLEDARLSVSKANLVLDMTAEGIQKDLIGETEKGDVMKSLVEVIGSDTALKIIHNTEDVLFRNEIRQSIPLIIPEHLIKPHSSLYSNRHVKTPSAWESDFYLSDDTVQEKHKKKKIVTQEHTQKIYTIPAYGKSLEPLPVQIQTKEEKIVPLHKAISKIAIKHLTVKKHAEVKNVKETSKMHLQEKHLQKETIKKNLEDKHSLKGIRHRKKEDDKHKKIKRLSVRLFNFDNSLDISDRISEPEKKVSKSALKRFTVRKH